MGKAKLERPRKMSPNTNNNNTDIEELKRSLENKLYSHSSPPKVVANGSGVHKIREYIRSGDIGALEELLLAGYGHALVNQPSTDKNVRQFLRTVPAYMSKIDLVHDAAQRGNLRDLKALLDRRKLARSRDSQGVGLLQKAVLGGHKEVLEYIMKEFPEAAKITDNGRFEFGVGQKNSMDDSAKKNQTIEAESNDQQFKKSSLTVHESQKCSSITLKNSSVSPFNGKEDERVPPVQSSSRGTSNFSDSKNYYLYEGKGFSYEKRRLQKLVETKSQSFSYDEESLFKLCDETFGRMQVTIKSKSNGVSSHKKHDFSWSNNFRRNNCNYLYQDLKNGGELVIAQPCGNAYLCNDSGKSMYKCFSLLDDKHEDEIQDGLHFPPLPTSTRSKSSASSLTEAYVTHHAPSSDSQTPDQRLINSHLRIRRRKSIKHHVDRLRRSRPVYDLVQDFSLSKTFSAKQHPLFKYERIQKGDKKSKYLTPLHSRSVLNNLRTIPFEINGALNRKHKRKSKHLVNGVETKDSLFPPKISEIGMKSNDFVDLIRNQSTENETNRKTHCSGEDKENEVPDQRKAHISDNLELFAQSMSRKILDSVSLLVTNEIYTSRIQNGNKAKEVYHMVFESDIDFWADIIVQKVLEDMTIFKQKTLRKEQTARYNIMQYFDVCSLGNEFAQFRVQIKKPARGSLLSYALRKRM